jgi:2-amino-4-hydroxy-6-hydroxymethyldihydropteridine diphosphokinase
VRAASRFFATLAFPPGSGGDYVNAAIAIETDPEATPRDLLAALHAVEASFGRQRARRWEGRALDLDLIAWGDRVLPDTGTQKRWANLPLDAQMTETPNELILPHPRVQDRAFVLVPLADIAANWVHPVTGRCVQQMLDALPEEDRIAVRA